MLRTVQSLPPCRAFDTGLRPDPFPHRAASLLPGLLAATRTGLPPASDDELTTTDQPPTRSTSCLLGARENLTASGLGDSGSVLELRRSTVVALWPCNRITLWCCHVLVLIGSTVSRLHRCIVVPFY